MFFLALWFFSSGRTDRAKAIFLDALRFVSGALHYNFGLDGAIQNRGGAENIRRRGSESFRIELTAQFESGDGQYELEIAPADNGGFRVIEESCEASHNASKSRYSAKNGQLVEGDERLKSAAEDGLILPLARNLPEFSNLSRALREFRLYSPHPPDIAAEKDEKAVFLDRTGSKTALIFDRLGEKTQRRVNQYLDAVVPGVSARAVFGWLVGAFGVFAENRRRQSAVAIQRIGHVRWDIAGACHSCRHFPKTRASGLLRNRRAGSRDSSVRHRCFARRDARGIFAFADYLHKPQRGFA